MLKKFIFLLLLIILFSVKGQTQTTIAYNSFEESSSETWVPLSFSTPPCTSGNDQWDYATSLDTIRPSDGNQFWGIRDLNGECGGAGYETISFPEIDISAYTNVTISFDYYTIGYENTDNLGYEVWEDGEKATDNISLQKDSQGWVTITYNVTAGTSNVKLILKAKQNGGSDYAGFDHVMLTGEFISTDEPDWCNLQYPSTGNISEGDSFTIYARVYEPGITNDAGQGTGIEAWIGYSSIDNNPTDPANSSNWTWVPASYNMDYGNNDEYMAEIGSALPSGNYYYASRFSLNNGPYVYGGYDDDGQDPPTPTGGFWENPYSTGTGNRSGKLSIDMVDWCNLQYPEDGTILQGDNYVFYAQVYEPGVTDSSGQGAGIEASIGYSTIDNDPTDPNNSSNWTWVPASYNVDSGNNDEYKVDIGPSLSPGTYYVASRFKINNGKYSYGGYNSGFWNSTFNDAGNAKSARLKIKSPPEIQIIGNNIEIINGDTTPQTEDLTDFGTIEINTISEHTFSIENLGETDLLLNGNPIIEISGDEAFTVSTQPDNTTIGENESVNFTIRFSPSTIGTFTATISISNNDPDENPYTFKLQGTSQYSQETDIIDNGHEAVNISSLINDATISNTTEGIEVWQFTIRDGGADLHDLDTSPTILDNLTITQASGNAMNDWADALQSVALFDGNTLIDNSPVITSNQIQFTGLNYTIPDDSQKTLSLRISLQTSPNDSGNNNDGDDFGFQISQSNVTATPEGSQFDSFDLIKSTNGKNIFEVIATTLYFIQQPVDTGVGSIMMPYPQVAATDINGNIDRDYNNSISITSSGNMENDPLNVNANNGTAVFDQVIHTSAGDDLVLTASSGSFAEITSNTFDIIEQTILEYGDIAILAVNTNINDGADEITFVCFKDINPGTQIYLTDNGYERKYSEEWGGTEGLISITRTSSTLPKGTVITIVGTSGSGNIYNGDDFDVYTCGNIDINWTKDALSGSNIGGFNLNNDDDVWLLQGGTWNNDTDHHSTYTGNVIYGWTESGWNNIPPDGSDRGTKFSNLFPSSKCFTTIAPTGDGKVKFKLEDFINNSDYDQLDWIAQINTTDNWVAYTDNTDYNSNGFDYKGDTNCPQINIANNAHYAGIWKGNTGTNWFDCSNWDNMVVPNKNTDVTILASANNAITIDPTAEYSDLYQDIAKAHDIIIESGTSLTMTESSLLEIYGNWENPDGENAFQEGTGKVIFKGNSHQNILTNEGTETEKFYDLEIDNDSGVSFSNGNIHAINELTLTKSPDLTIPDGKYILAGKNLINNGINITVENQGSFVQNQDSGTIIDIESAVYTVNKTSQPLDQYYEYVYWTSPIKEGNLTLGDIVSNAWGYYEYDPADTSYPAYPGWIIKTESDLFKAGVGYAISAPIGTSGNITLTPSFTKGNDPFNSGNITYSLRLSEDNDPAGDDDYNLIGNPYPSAIDFNTFAINNTNIEGAYYAWTNCAGLLGNHHQEQGYTVYSVNSGSISACSGDGLTAGRFVASAQGIMVEAIDEGEIIFKNSYRVIGNNDNFVNKQSKAIDRIWLNLTSNQGLFNQILLAFSPQATNSYDRLFDAHSLSSGTGQEFYSYLNNEKWAIQGLAPWNNKEMNIPLGINSQTQSTVTFHLNKKEGLEKVQIFLWDKKDNSYHDLLVEDYTTKLDAGEINDRFLLVLKQMTLNINPEIDGNETLIYQQDDNFIIESTDKKINSLYIYDSLGQILFKKQNINKNKTSLKLNISKGNLIFFFIASEEGNTFTKKLLVK
jgi:hypothetical protein